jgi:hypothetical protein
MHKLHTASYARCADVKSGSLGGNPVRCIRFTTRWRQFASRNNDSCILRRLLHRQIAAAHSPHSNCTGGDSPTRELAYSAVLASSWVQKSGANCQGMSRWHTISRRRGRFRNSDCLLAFHGPVASRLRGVRCRSFNSTGMQWRVGMPIVI